MELTVAAAVLAASLLHAAWHALVKSSGDQITALAGMNLISGAAAITLIPFVSLPTPIAAVVIAVSVLLHVGYKLALARLYRRVDLSLGYPVARGITPVMATVLAFASLGETPSTPALLGILCISLGIIGLLFDRAGSRMSWSTFFAGAAAGLAVAAYSVIDAYGVRINDDWLGFTVWLVASDSTAFVAYALATRGGAAPSAWLRSWGCTLVSGLLGIASFGILMWALARAQVGLVTALRESSMIFAAIIGTVFLGEQVTRPRVGSCVFIMAGAAALALVR